jgi:hypothetical protein
MRGQWAVGWWAGVLAVNFEADDDSGEGSELLPRTWFRSQDRAASCCVRCEAVLVEPKSVEYTPPADGSAAVAGRSQGRRRRSAVSMPEPAPAPASAPVTAEPGTEVAADASDASGASGGGDAAAEGGAGGNGNGNGAGHGADG